MTLHFADGLATHIADVSDLSSEQHLPDLIDSPGELYHKLIGTGCQVSEGGGSRPPA